MVRLLNISIYKLGNDKALHVLIKHNKGNVPFLCNFMPCMISIPNIHSVNGSLRWFLGWIYLIITTYPLSSKHCDHATGHSILLNARLEAEKVRTVFVLEHGDIINILSCKAVLSSGKRRKSHMLHVVSREVQTGLGLCLHKSPFDLHSVGKVWIWWKPSECSDSFRLLKNDPNAIPTSWIVMLMILHIFMFCL